MIRLDLAWWTLEAVELVDKFLASRPAARVFEYGSGASTVWLSSRTSEVISIEHDAEWQTLVSLHTDKLPGIKLISVAAEQRSADSTYVSGRKGWSDMDFETYVRQLESAGGLFDLIIVDGRARSACLAMAIKRIKPDGIILFDNSDRPRYRRAIEDCNLQRLETRGLAACLPTPDATLLLSKNKEVLSRLHNAV
jgi:predicted O-methyltransferase YrrM